MNKVVALIMSEWSGYFKMFFWLPHLFLLLHLHHFSFFIPPSQQHMCACLCVCFWETEVKQSHMQLLS